MRRAAWAALLSTALFMVLFSSQASAAATPCADLEITNISINPEPPVAGLFFNVEITVHNAGTCAAPGFVTQWRQDRFASRGPSTSLPSLGAGESSTVTIVSDFVYPKAGNYESIAEVDTGHAVAETNEVNNLEIKSVSVGAATRNLKITSITFSPTPVVQGRQATASITMQNTGNSPSGDFRLSLTPQAFATPLSRQITSLAPGETRTVTILYTYPSAGTKAVSATIDSQNQVVETNESDNTFKTSLVVEPPLPDLEVTSVRISPQPSVTGQPTTAEVTVTNTGNNPAGTFVVKWQPRPGTQALTEEIGGLAVGESQTVTFTHNFPAVGTFAGLVTADATNAVKEVSESNNTFKTSVNVAKGTVDLTITDLHIECAGGGNTLTTGCQNTGANPVQGEAFYAVITVQNIGNAPSGQFTTEWNPDTTEIIPQGPHTVSDTTGPLGAGESRVIRLLFTYPLKGNFRTIAHVDAFNTVAETVETNNDKILNLVVDPAPIDLVIDSFTIDPGSPVRGIPATATITVRNAGPLATGAFSVQWKPQADSILPPTASVNGLNPGESRTITLTSTYGKVGNYTSSAIVDVFNTVLEPFGEGNNTVTKAVTVVPQMTTVDVTLKAVHVFNDGDSSLFQGDSAEWEQLFGVFDPTRGPCVYDNYGIHAEIPTVVCNQWRQDDVDSGETLTPPAADKTIRVTLLESTPLAVVYAAADRDNTVVGPDFPDVRGFTYLLSFAPKYRTLGTQTLKGQKCNESDDHCFDIDVGVTVVSSNVPTAMMALAAPSTSADTAPANVSIDDTSGITDTLAALPQPPTP